MSLSPLHLWISLSPRHLPVSQPALRTFRSRSHSTCNVAPEQFSVAVWQQINECKTPQRAGDQAAMVAALTRDHAHTLQARVQGLTWGSRCPSVPHWGVLAVHGASVDGHFVQYKASWCSTTLTPASHRKSSCWDFWLQERLMRFLLSFICSHA